jgi:phenylacetate-CoA ligase
VSVATASRSPLTAIIAGAVFPLHERLKGHDSVRRRRELERTQWLPAAELDALVARRLRAFLQDVGKHSPFWRERFARYAFDPEAVQGPADLARLPLLEKADIRAHATSMRADDAGPLKRYNTGGSSGEPLVFFMGRDRIDHDVAAKWRATRWWKVDMGDPEIVVWGSPVELSAQDRMRAWRDRLLRTTLLPAFDMTPASLDRYVATIRNRRPRMVFGYPSSLAVIARHAIARGVPLDDLGVRVVFVTSERLYDEQRQAIERAFAAPVANGYGARDAGFIAHQCPRGGMHVSAEDIVVEIVDPVGTTLPPGERGEIVVTHLATRDFPFVRYRTGDVGALVHGRCDCGRELPRLASIDGRTTDFVVARDGTVMHGLALIYTVRELPGVTQFRIEQQDLHHTEVLVVADAAFRPEHEARIVRDFKARLGPEVNVTVRRCDAIPQEASGKYRYVVSRVPAFAPRAESAA